MFKQKRQTTKPRRNQTRPRVLEVRVLSPRIAWFSFLKILGKLTKLACILAVITGIGWSVWQGIQRAFYENPDFRLQLIDLNTNPVIDEVGVVEAAGIDLTASLFEIDVTAVAEKLKALPAIADARAERHLPGKLLVRVTPRLPQAWISTPESGLPSGRQAGAMLVDTSGIAYPCPEMQVESAAGLPIIHLPLSAAQPIIPGAPVKHPQLTHCLRLLNSASTADSHSIAWIESIEQVNSWSLRIITRDGTSATFGLGDHVRQIQSLRAAMDHSSQKGYSIQTINLIPKQNIPITLRDESQPPPRAVPVSEPASTTAPLAPQSRNGNTPTPHN
jgi:hypothetical protein